MSYILDALKKAERERGTGRLPWLTRAQGPQETERNRLMKIAGGILLGAVVLPSLFWFFFADYLRQPKPQPVATEPARSTAFSQPDQAGGADRPGPSSSVARPQVAPAAAQPGYSQEAAAPGAAEKKLNSRADAEDAARLQPAPDQKRRTTQITQGAQPSVPQTTAAPPVEVVLPVPDDNASNTPTKEGAPPARQTTTPESLAEAVTKMTLNMLMYEEAEADRRVYINGKKYRKGDLVDGKYLIEQIAREGVTLSHEGARAILRPR